MDNADAASSNCFSTYHLFDENSLQLEVVITSDLSLDSNSGQESNSLVLAVGGVNVQQVPQVVSLCPLVGAICS